MAQIARSRSRCSGSATSADSDRDPEIIEQNRAKSKRSCSKQEPCASVAVLALRTADLALLSGGSQGVLRWLT